MAKEKWKTLREIGFKAETKRLKKQLQLKKLEAEIEFLDAQSKFFGALSDIECEANQLGIKLD